MMKYVVDLIAKRNLTIALDMKKKAMALAMLWIMLFLWSPSARCEGPLQKGATEWGLSVGYGDNFHFGGDVEEDLNFYFLTPFWGKVFRTWPGRGSLEFVGEGFLSHVRQDSKDRYAIGVTPLIVYNFETSGRIIPFLELGAGILYTDLDPKGFGSCFDFTPQAGLGIRYRLGHDTFLRFSYRVHHISNGGIDRDNNVGINSHFFSVGISFFP
jgi:hypothetical protein